MMYWLVEGVYRVAIRLYPRDFRLRYRDEILHDFRERGRAEASKGGMAAGHLYWFRAIAGVIPSVFRIRMESVRVSKKRLRVFIFPIEESRVLCSGSFITV